MSGDDSEFFSESITIQEGPIHSTPIKDGPFKRPLRLGRVTARVEPSSPVRHVNTDVNQIGVGHGIEKSLPLDQQIKPQLQVSSNKQSPRNKSSGENPASSLDSSTIQKQRREIQLLIQELRDRDNELNETVSAHSHQLLAWERDRQRLLTLEQKCARYEVELQKKRRQLEVAVARLRSAQSQEQNNTSSLSTTQEQLDRVTKEKELTVTQVDNLEKQNVSLNDSLKALSGTVGQLEAREQELMTLLRIKEKEIEQATVNVIELNSRVQQLDIRCRECQTQEAEAVNRATQWKQKYTQSRSEIENLTDAVQRKDAELEQQGKELAGLHQQLVSVQEELLITGERERRKDEVIESLRCKQERTLAELRSVRELYERQQREITLMQLNLDSSKENSNQNSKIDHSITLDDSIISLDSQPVQHVSPQQQEADTDNRHVSFEERLSTFLDQDTDTEAVCHLDASPASKLQRLLTESRVMIENLEKSTLPANTNVTVEGTSDHQLPQTGRTQNFSEQEANVIQLRGSTESSENPSESFQERFQYSPEHFRHLMSRQSTDCDPNMHTFSRYRSHDQQVQVPVSSAGYAVPQEVFTDVEKSDILRRQVDS